MGDPCEGWYAAHWEKQWVHEWKDVAVAEIGHIDVWLWMAISIRKRYEWTI